MILLFNTAYRPGYIRNILRTIFLPGGAKNQYRYTLGGNISKEAIEKLLAKGAHQNVLICYGDRFSSGGYTFYPVRFGRLESIDCAGGRAYFRVFLGDHASCDAPETFTKLVYEFSAASGQRAPELTFGNPREEKDGTYAIYIEPSAINGVVDTDEQSWASTARRLAQTTAFKATGANYVFAKCELFVNGKEKSYLSSGNSPHYEYGREDDVRLAVSYVYPGLQHGHPTANLSLKTPAGLQVLGASSYPLDMPENRLEFPLTVEPASGKNYFTIDFEFGWVSAAGPPNLFGPNDAIAFKIHEALWRTWSAFGGVASYAIGAWLAASGPSSAPWGEFLKVVGVVGIFFGLRGKRIV